MSDPMQQLIDYVTSHNERGTCLCGKCIDHPGENEQPTGHTADLVFFQVSARNSPDADKLKELVRLAETHGVHGNTNLFDEKEHNYLEIGGWIGDQGLAMQLMGLGTILGLWDLMTPKMLPGLEDDMVMEMAGIGMISILPKKE